MLELRPSCECFDRNLVPRPIRPASALQKDPASTDRVFTPGLHRG